MDGDAALAVLGLAPGATSREIKQAFRRRALVAHPDRRGPAGAFTALRRAYDVALTMAAPEPVRPTAALSTRRWLTPPTTTTAPVAVDVTDIAVRPPAPAAMRRRPAPAFEEVLAAALAA